MLIRASFWPLDFDEEVEIYDNPSWNLPGRRKQRRAEKQSAASSRRHKPLPDGRGSVIR